jgi:3-deoxy-D-manno-octulosonic-acid transferase
MQYFYSFSIRVYGKLMWFAAFFHPKAKEWVSGRKHLFQNLPTLNQKEVYWFHCASLGEFDMALPLMNAIKEKNPAIFILVTFFSPSGMNHYTKRKHQVDLALYLPLDTASNAQKFMQQINPKILFIVKYEFWNNFISAAKKNGVSVVSVCTLLRPNQRFFSWYGTFFRNTLRQIDFFYVQNLLTQNLLNSIGIFNTLITGDTRYDQVISAKKTNPTNTTIELFLNQEKAIILGSIWEIDTAILEPFIRNHPETKFIVAPHQIDEGTIAKIENGLKGLTLRFSELDNGTKWDENLAKQVLILDTIGHLTAAYSFGSFAYIGGGFTGKLHNILEPAAYDLPVVFGPKYTNFPEAEEFISTGIGFSVSSREQMENAYRHIQRDYREIAAKTTHFMEEKTGATRLMVEHVNNHFGSI